MSDSTNTAIANLISWHLEKGNTNFCRILCRLLDAKLDNISSVVHIDMRISDLDAYDNICNIFLSFGLHLVNASFSADGISKFSIAFLTEEN